MLDWAPNAEVEIEIRNFAGDGRPVLLGVTERLEVFDAPGGARRRPEALPGARVRDDGEPDFNRDRPFAVGLSKCIRHRKMPGHGGLTVEYRSEGTALTG